MIFFHLQDKIPREIKVSLDDFCPLFQSYHHTHLCPRAVPKPVRTTYQSQNMLCAFSHTIFPLASFILKSYSTPKAQIKILPPPWRPPWWYPLSVRTSLLHVCVPVTIKLHIYWYILLIVHVYVHVHVYQGTIHNLYISQKVTQGLWFK